MNKQVSKSQFKARALEYFREVERTGKAIIVTDRGQAVLEIKPYKDKSLPPLERLQGKISRYDSPLEPVSEDDWNNA
ncbi:MAG: type II toxin-antitoxin system Phd/YefM family antitoxin [Alphaproteobacteria bacterium]|nr:MAG: type II toxin-antitoxin system Phd/YefM family antitoxin [Alphaproteobacteria bacterium]